MSDVKQFDRSQLSFSPERERISTRPVAASRWSGLQSGPQHTRTYEVQPGVPVDGSNARLRSYSPFKISILPPLIFDNVQSRSFLNSVRRAFTPTVNRAANVLNSFLAGEDRVIEEEDDPYLIPDSDLTPHFTFDDFRSRFRNGAVPDNLRDNVRRLAEQLEIILDACSEILGYRTRLTIISGYRTPEHNAACNGAANSQHLQAKAADIRVDGFEPRQVLAIVNELINSGSILQGGLGFYVTFVHYDIRGTAARWTSSENGEDPEISLQEATKFLPPGPPPSEILRAREEAGISEDSALQIRAIDGPPPDPEIVDAARDGDRGFKALLSRRTLQQRALANGALATNGRDQIDPDTFIARGRLGSSTEASEFQEPGFIDRQIAADIVNQLQEILNVPPLTLLINPTSMNITRPKLLQFSQRTRQGFVFQAWGEEQPVMSISGKIGAFIAGANPLVGVLQPGEPTPSATGAQFASKRDSASYQNLMALLSIYKNNGYIHDTINNTNAHHFVGSISIEYDQRVFVGNFNSFNWGYQDDQPNGGLTFEIEFGISQEFDNHRAVDNLLPLKAPTQSPSDTFSVFGSNVRNGFGSTLEPPVDQIQGQGFVRGDQADSTPVVETEADSVSGYSPPPVPFPNLGPEFNTGADVTPGTANPVFNSDFDDEGNATTQGANPP